MPLRFGIFAVSRFLSDSSKSAGTMSFTCSAYAVAAYTSSPVSDCGAVQVVRDVGLARRNTVDDLADAAFAFAQGVEDVQTGRLAQQSEEARNGGKQALEVGVEAHRMYAHM